MIYVESMEFVHGKFTINIDWCKHRHIFTERHNDNSSVLGTWHVYLLDTRTFSLRIHTHGDVCECNERSSLLSIYMSSLMSL